MGINGAGKRGGLAGRASSKFFNNFNEGFPMSNLRAKLVKATRLAIIAGSATALVAVISGCSTTGQNANGAAGSQAMSSDNNGMAASSSNACKGMAACKGYAKKSVAKKKKHGLKSKKSSTTSSTSSSQQSS